MKKLLAWFMVLTCVFVFCWMVADDIAEAQVQGSGPYVKYHWPDTITVDSAYSADAWENAATVIATLSDSGYFVIAVSFTADLSKYEQLYWGISNDSAGNGGKPTYDTGQTGVQYSKNARRVNIYDMWVDSTQISADGGATDTFYFWMSTGDDVTNVLVEDLIMKVDPLAYDSGA
jgi:hypothetical protein